MNNKERKIISKINYHAINEHEINLYYDLEQNNLYICNDSIQLNNLNCSLSNFKTILTELKRKTELKTDNINGLIEIYL